MARVRLAYDAADDHRARQPVERRTIAWPRHHASWVTECRRRTRPTGEERGGSGRRLVFLLLPQERSLRCAGADGGFGSADERAQQSRGSLGLRGNEEHPPSGVVSIATAGSSPSRRRFLFSSRPAGWTAAAVTWKSSSRHAAGLPRHARTSETGMPRRDRTFSASPPLEKVTASVLCRPKVASEGWPR